jgi:hypothetical protein
MADQIEIKEILFLTPAKMTANINGVKKTMMLSVDIVNKKAYTQDGDDSLSEQFFEFLNAVHVLPEDFFSASQEVMDEVQDAYETQMQITEQSIERSMGIYE